MAVDHPSVEVGRRIGRVVDREEPLPIGLEQEMGNEPRKDRVVVAPDKLEPPRKTRDGRPVGIGVRRGADVPEEEGPIVGEDRMVPVLDQDPVLLCRVAAEEGARAVEGDITVPEVKVTEEPRLAVSGEGGGDEFVSPRLPVVPESLAPDGPVRELGSPGPAAKGEVEARMRSIADQDQEARRVERATKPGETDGWRWRPKAPEETAVPGGAEEASALSCRGERRLAFDPGRRDEIALHGRVEQTTEPCKRLFDRDGDRHELDRRSGHCPDRSARSRPSGDKAFELTGEKGQVGEGSPDRISNGAEPDAVLEPERACDRDNRIEGFGTDSLRDAAELLPEEP